MAKVQIRRSISIGRPMFDQVKGIAEAVGVPLSQFTEAALRVYIASGPTRKHTAGVVRITADQTREIGILEIDEHRGQPRPATMDVKTPAAVDAWPSGEIDHVTMTLSVGAMPPTVVHPTPPPAPDPNGPIEIACNLHRKANCLACPRPTCALCVETIKGLVFRQPFGRNDAMVFVCERCMGEHPREGGYAFNGRDTVTPNTVGQGNKRTGRGGR